MISQTKAKLKCIYILLFAKFSWQLFPENWTKRYNAQIPNAKTLHIPMYVYDVAES